MNKLQIGNVILDNQVILAPMAGVSDLPFRLLCRQQGAGLVCSEMVSAKAIYYKNKNTEELMRIQVDAVKNIKIDKVTVWDGGEGRDGKTATAGFVSGLMKSIPPMNEMFDMAGIKLPEYLGTEKKDAPTDNTAQ